MFTTLRKEFKQLFEAFISSGNVYVAERDKRVKENYKQEIEVLKVFHKELEELKTFKSGVSNLFATGFGCTIASGGVWESEIKIKGMEKCYFTKELIADDATNTKVLYLVNGSESKKVFVKECNITKEVKEINGKLYLFTE